MKLKEKPKKNVTFQFLKDFFDAEQTDIQNEKMIRCKEFQLKQNQDKCFRENTFKEELILEHVKKFEDQFKLDHPNRKLFLYP